MGIAAIILLLGALVFVMAYGTIETWRANRSIDRDLEGLKCLTNGHRTHKVKNGLRSCKCGATLGPYQKP